MALAALAAPIVGWIAEHIFGFEVGLASPFAKLTLATVTSPVSALDVQKPITAPLQGTASTSGTASKDHK